jgi:hypothetical protein
MFTVTAPMSIRWHALRKAQGRLDALVVVLARPQDLAFARTLAARWGHAVPHCHFVAGRGDFHVGRVPARNLGALLGAKLRRLKVPPAQTILIGVGEAARCAFDLVVLGALAGLGAIVVDMAPVSAMPVLPVLPPMGAALRFLCHAPADDRERRDFDTMLRGLRQTAIDLRIMTLPPGPDAASRAIGGFLIELVARADWSRSIPFAVPLPTTPFSPESQS